MGANGVLIPNLRRIAEATAQRLWKALDLLGEGRTENESSLMDAIGTFLVTLKHQRGEMKDLRNVPEIASQQTARAVINQLKKENQNGKRKR